MAQTVFHYERAHAEHRLPADSGSKLYVVFNQRDTSAANARALLVTEDPQEAVTHAQQHHGVVYEYTITLFYDGTNG
jgi:hypothetical protein